jgi:hypothetical protein
VLAWVGSVMIVCIGIMSIYMVVGISGGI